MSVAKFLQPDFTSQQPTVYKTAIDGSIAVIARVAAAFAPHETTPQAMQVVVDAGATFYNNAVNNVAAQTVTIAAAPTTAGISRIDRIVYNATGVASVVLGTPSNTPVAPAIPDGSFPLAQVYVGTNYTAITNADLTDERVGGAGGGAGGFGSEVSIASAATTNLAAATGNVALITGTTTITSFGNTASTNRPIYLLRFAAALTLTYNATSMILPGLANIAVRAGDSALVQYMGGSNWVVHEVMRRDGTAVKAAAGASFSNLRCTHNAANPTTRVVISANDVLLTDGLGAFFLAQSVSLTINAATVGANGLDAGSLANSTWYHMWVISNGTTVAGLLSTSATAPTMPSGYTYKMRVGTVTTNGSAQFIPFLQRNYSTQYVVTASVTTLPQLATGSLGTPPSTYASVSVSAAVPPTAATVKALIMTNSGGSYMYLAPNSLYNSYAGTTPPPIAIYNPTANASGWGGDVLEMELESSNIYAISFGGANKLFCFGYTDNL